MDLGFRVTPEGNIRELTEDEIKEDMVILERTINQFVPRKEKGNTGSGIGTTP